MPAPPCVHGYVDKSGKEVIAPKYYFGGKFRHGYALCYGPDKSGRARSAQIFVDKHGNEFTTDFISTADVKEKNFVNIGFKTILFEGDLKEISSRNSLRLMRNSYRLFVIDKDGTRFEIPSGQLISCGLNPKTGNQHFLKDGKSFEFTGRGKVGEIPGMEPAEPSLFIPPHVGVTTKLNEIYDYFGEFSEGLVPAWSKKRGWCFLDKNGTVRLTLPKECCSAQPFSEGLAAIAVTEKHFEEGGEQSTIWPPAGSKFGFINKIGKFVISPTFPCPSDGEWRSQFRNGIALATAEKNLSTAYGYIDKRGKFVIPAKYSKLEEFSEGLAAFDSREPGFELMDWKDGRCKYKKLSHFLRQFDIGSMNRTEIVKRLGEPDSIRKNPDADRYKLGQDCFGTQYFDIRYKADGTVYGHACSNECKKYPEQIEPSEWVVSTEKPEPNEDIYKYYSRVAKEVYPATVETQTSQ